MKLRWEPPLADGGSEITNYIIEKRETSRANWALVTSNIHGHITDCSVEKLIEGHEYQFRVSAENQYGVGDAIMTEPVTVKNPYGERGPPDRSGGSHVNDSVVAPLYWGRSTRTSELTKMADVLFQMFPDLVNLPSLPTSQRTP